MAEVSLHMDSFPSSGSSSISTGSSSGGQCYFFQNQIEYFLDTLIQKIFFIDNKSKDFSGLSNRYFGYKRRTGGDIDVTHNPALRRAMHSSNTCGMTICYIETVMTCSLSALSPKFLWAGPILANLAVVKPKNGGTMQASRDDCCNAEKL